MIMIKANQVKGKELALHYEDNTLNTPNCKSRRQRLTAELQKIINIPCPELQCRFFSNYLPCRVTF